MKIIIVGVERKNDPEQAKKTNNKMKTTLTLTHFE